MKLWILKAREDLPDDENPWEPWCDTKFGFVIRAGSEARARIIAQSLAGFETHNAPLTSKTPWLDDKYSTCDELTAEGDEEVLLIDGRAG